MTDEKKDFIPDRSKFKDSQGRFLTQSLFLEAMYNTDYAVYSLSDEDKLYDGKVYPSLRRLYLNCMDPTEYEFANKYLWGWEHWQRLCANKSLMEEFEKWRDELEVKLRGQAVRQILASGIDNFSAAKWAADGKWKEQKVGRPSKEEKAIERKKRERIADELESDGARIIDFLPRKEK